MPPLEGGRGDCVRRSSCGGHLRRFQYTLALASLSIIHARTAGEANASEVGPDLLARGRAVLKERTQDNENPERVQPPVVARILQRATLIML